MVIHCKYDELRDVSALKAHPKNRNKHPEDQIDRLAKILKYQGLRAPIVVSKRSGKIVKGHGTLQAIKKNGWKEAPVVVQDFEDDDQEWLFVQSDNAIAMWAELDLKGINADLSELGPFDIDLIGIKDFEVEPLDKLLGDDDAVPDVKPTDIKLGDLFVLGDHRLLCGDSTDASQVEKLMNGEKADMVFTDPPYGFNYIKKSDKSTIQNDGKEFAEIIKKAVSNIKTEIFYICGDSKTAKQFLIGTESLGSPKNCIVWIKPIQHRMHKWEPCHELIWYWGDNGSPFYGANVFEAKREINKTHPTIKPIELIEYCFEAHKKNVNVADLFGGSGSTLIACEKTNRKCFMMELDPQYCQVIIDRWEQYTGKKAVKDASGKTT